MSTKNILFLITLFLSIGCKNKKSEIDFNRETYFVGKWEVNRPTPVEMKKPIPIIVDFIRDGVFELNIKDSDPSLPLPKRRWFYNSDKKELTLFNAEVYLIETQQIDSFTAKQQSTGVILLFNRK